MTAGLRLSVRRAGRSRSARPIAIAPAPAAVTGRVRVAVIGGRVAVVVVRGIAVGSVIAVSGPCQRASDDRPDGKTTQRGAPPTPAGVRRGRCGNRCEGERSRCSKSGQGFPHDVYLTLTNGPRFSVAVDANVPSPN